MIKFLICVNIFISLAASAQSGETTISFKGGVSFPVGKFASRDLRMAETGLAKRGRIGEVAISHLMKSNKYGLVAAYSFASYDFDSQAMEDDRNSRVSPDAGKWTVGQASHKISSFNFGFFYNAKISERSSIRLTGLIGPAKMKYPSHQDVFNSTPSGGYRETFTAEKSVTNLQFGFATSFNAHITKALIFLLDMQYVGTKADYEVTLTERTFVNTTYTTDFIQTVKIARLSISTGIGLSF